ncbi:hypothetical protein M2421_001138 [Stenotrophomonas sp. BIGb0135]|nr:hypothetical protein [Stenotrophomonas sp. BIGb0135]
MRIVRKQVSLEIISRSASTASHSTPLQLATSATAASSPCGDNLSPDGFMRH